VPQAAGGLDTAAISQVTSGIGYVMANDCAAVLSASAARTCDVSRAGLGCVLTG
jgi:hypothetical protein